MRQFLFYALSVGRPKPDLPLEDCEEFNKVDDQVRQQRGWYVPEHRSLLFLTSVGGLIGWIADWPTVSFASLIVIAGGTGVQWANEYLTTWGALSNDRMRLGK